MVNPSSIPPPLLLHSINWRVPSNLWPLEYKSCGRFQIFKTNWSFELLYRQKTEFCVQSFIQMRSRQSTLFQYLYFFSILKMFFVLQLRTFWNIKLHAGLYKIDKHGNWENECFLSGKKCSIDELWDSIQLF